jgi:hypothetical protein
MARAFYQRLKAHGVQVDFTAEHFLTKSVYFFDPDGNRLEIFCESMEMAAAKQYLHEARELSEMMQPLDLESAPVSQGSLASRAARPVAGLTGGSNRPRAVTGVPRLPDICSADLCGVLWRACWHA